MIYFYENRLRANLRVDCDSDQHLGYQVFASIMICLYPLGVPLVGALLLAGNKKSIRTYLALREQLELNDGTTKVIALKAPPHDIKVFQSLFEHYRPDYYWWGILDMLYGLLLTGFAVLFAPGSMMQITLAFLIGLGYYALQLSCKPYRNPYHNFMVALVNLNVTLTIFASLLLKVDNEMGGSLIYEAGYDVESISTFLILCNAIIFFEFCGYSKRAVELATGVAIVHCENSKDEQAKDANDGAPRSHFQKLGTIGAKLVSPLIWLYRQILSPLIWLYNIDCGAAFKAPVTLDELKVQIAAASARKQESIDNEDWKVMMKHHLQLKVLEEKRVVLLEEMAAPGSETISEITGGEALRLFSQKLSAIGAKLASPLIWLYKKLFSPRPPTPLTKFEATVKLSMWLRRYSYARWVRTRIGGCYFPRVLNGNVWGPFPYTSTYRHVYNLLLFCVRCLPWSAESAAVKATVTVDELNAQIVAVSERKQKSIAINDFDHAKKHHLQLEVLEEEKVVLLKALAAPAIETISETTGAETATWSWWWSVDVYVNDTSGWIIQRTSTGWEARPELSGNSKFASNGVTRYPPSSGWTAVDAGPSTAKMSSVCVPLRFQSWPDVSSWPSRIHGVMLAPLISVIRGLWEQCSPNPKAVAKGLGSDLATPLVPTEADVENPTIHPGRRTTPQTEGEFGDWDYMPPRMSSHRGSYVEMPERASSARPF